MRVMPSRAMQQPTAHLTSTIAGDHTQDKRTWRQRWSKEAELVEIQNVKNPFHS